MAAERARHTATYAKQIKKTSSIRKHRFMRQGANPHNTLQKIAANTETEVFTEC